MRAPVNRETVLRLRVDDEAGQLQWADAASTLSVTITDGAGAAVVSSSGSEAGYRDGTTTGLYKYTLAPQTKLDRLTATWTVVVGGVTRTVVDYLDVIGQRLVPLWRLKEDLELSTASTEVIQRIADTIEEWVSSVLGIPCVPEGARVSWWVQRQGMLDTYPTVTGLPYGAGASRLYIPEIMSPLGAYAITANGQALSPSDLALVVVNQSALEFSDGRPWAPGPYTAWVSHGAPQPPEDLRRAAVALAREVIRTSAYPGRASSVTTDKAVINFALPGPDRPTGIAEVDAALVRYRTSVVI